MTAEGLDFGIPESEVNRRQALQRIEGIRQKSLRRLLVIDQLLKYEFHQDGPVYQDWLDRKREPINPSLANFIVSTRVDDLYSLEDTAREVFSDEKEAKYVVDLLDVSQRTMEDYQKAVKAWYHL